MRKDYEPGTRIKGMWPRANEGTIIKGEETYGRFMYRVRIDGMAWDMMLSFDEVAPIEHQWHKQMQVWRDEGISRGFTGIVIGIKDHAFKAFFVGVADSYSKIKLHNPDVSMKYYWVL